MPPPTPDQVWGFHGLLRFLREQPELASDPTLKEALREDEVTTGSVQQWEEIIEKIRTTKTQLHRTERTLTSAEKEQAEVEAQIKKTTVELQEIERRLFVLEAERHTVMERSQGIRGDARALEMELFLLEKTRLDLDKKILAERQITEEKLALILRRYCEPKAVAPTVTVVTSDPAESELIARQNAEIRELRDLLEKEHDALIRLSVNDQSSEVSALQRQLEEERKLRAEAQAAESKAKDALRKQWQAKPQSPSTSPQKEPKGDVDKMQAQMLELQAKLQEADRTIQTIRNDNSWQQQSPQQNGGNQQLLNELHLLRSRVTTGEQQLHNLRLAEEQLRAENSRLIQAERNSRLENERMHSILAQQAQEKAMEIQQEYNQASWELAKLHESERVLLEENARLVNENAFLRTEIANQYTPPDPHAIYRAPEAPLFPGPVRRSPTRSPARPRQSAHPLGPAGSAPPSTAPLHASPLRSSTMRPTTPRAAETNIYYRSYRGPQGSDVR